MADETEITEEQTAATPEATEQEPVAETENGEFTAEQVQNLLSESGEEVPLDSIYDIPVQVTVVLGKSSIPINNLLRLGRGAVLELERKVGEPVDVYVNGRIVARGEVVIVEDKIGITMTEVIKLES